MVHNTNMLKYAGKIKYTYILPIFFNQFWFNALYFYMYFNICLAYAMEIKLIITYKNLL